MNRLALALCFTIFGCGKKTAPAPATPFERLLAEDESHNPNSVKMCADPWDEAMAKYQQRLGTPAKIEGDKYTWAIVDGDRCAMLWVVRGECPPSWNKPGLRMAGTSEPVLTTKKAPNEQLSFEECEKIATAGATKAAPAQPKPN